MTNHKPESPAKSRFPLLLTIITIIMGVALVAGSIFTIATIIRRALILFLPETN